MWDLLLVFTAVFVVFFLYFSSKWDKYKKQYMERRNIKYYNPSLWGVFFNKYTAIEFFDVLYNGPDEP